ncbi:RdgB/HAM1 family non-canonical purine NTP pyrophosphatase [Spiroplasma endosymbiont of Virgichneumon dumeticola]|uniref:RdgB/HAM1 family non-canonical purine NTP pyrophosphatase n=1 Tax=Spiroplasma endosymbiont of Virgichneumon dumeticola TaxID=3139323 RepID=UPI0035C8A7A5
MVIKTLWFASNNPGKVMELKAMLAPYGYEIKSILDLSSPIEINETGDSFSENAVLKAKTLARLVNTPVIGDDSGLEILALNNFPGIHSARWKGSMSYHEAMVDILEQMKGHNDRSAMFISAIAYVDLNHNISKTFIGKLEGEITIEIKGNYGFGYDQIFYIPSQHATLGEMTLEDKNKISHRYSALSQLLKFLETLAFE